MAERYNCVIRRYTIMKKLKLIKKLEKYKYEENLTQKEISNYLKVSFATVNRWFRGHCKPSKTHRYHIRKLLKIEEPKQHIRQPSVLDFL